MLTFLKPKFIYKTLNEDERDGELKLESGTLTQSKQVIIKTGLYSMVLVIILFLSAIVSSWAVFFQFNHVLRGNEIVPTSSHGPSWFCQTPPTRHEWRTLAPSEQQEYIRAVRCLTTRPSKLSDMGTVYDDFPWVHKHTSSNSKSSDRLLEDAVSGV